MKGLSFVKEVYSFIQVQFVCNCRILNSHSHFVAMISKFPPKIEDNLCVLMTDYF